MKKFIVVFFGIIFLFIVAKFQIEKENKKRSQKIANSIMNPLIKEDLYSFIDDENFSTYSLQEAKERYKNSWQKSFGGKYDDAANGVIQINDGGIIVIGLITSLDSTNGYILKLDRFGNKVWDKVIGGVGFDEINAAVKTKDGGFATVGSTQKKDRFDSDIWVIKFDKNGNKIWEKTFGGDFDDFASVIIQTDDGGFLIGGVKSYCKESVSNLLTKNVKDLWIIKLDKNGKKEWERVFNKSYSEEIFSIQKTKDGHFLIGAISAVNGANKKVLAWIIKVDSLGNKIWEKLFDKFFYSEKYLLTPSSDGGFFYIRVKTLDKKTKAVAVKFNKNGKKEWERVFKKTNFLVINSIKQTKDGNFILGGAISKANNKQGWIAKIDKNAKLLNELSFGNRGFDIINDIIQTKDGSIAAAGETESNKEKEEDIWVVRFDKEFFNPNFALELAKIWQML